MSAGGSWLVDLDEMLEEYGEDIVLQRFATDSEGVQSVTNTATCRAVVRLGSPQELVVISGEAPNTRIIMSPSDLAAAGWPGLPGKDDRVLIQGIANNIEMAMPISVGGQLVRIELQTRT
jgi:hypothetical protein